MPTAEQQEVSLLYVWDAYCGWCYGLSKELTVFHEAHPEVPIELISGGLFTGERRGTLADFPYMQEANQHITELRGVTFGAGYQAAVADGQLFLDSEQAARGFAALRSSAPEQAFELGKAMQTAFYQEGKSLSQLETYEEIADYWKLDGAQVRERWMSPESTMSAQQDFLRARQFGVSSYPTLILRKSDEYFLIGGGAVTAHDIEKALLAIN